MDTIIHDGKYTCWEDGKLVVENVYKGKCTYSCEFREYKACSAFYRKHSDPASLYGDEEEWDTTAEKDSMSIGINSPGDLNEKKRHLRNVLETTANRKEM